MLYTHVAAGLAGLAIGFAGAWQTQNWRYGAIEAKRLAAQVEAEKKRDKSSYDASVNFEKGKENVRTVFETIEIKVTEVVDRPIYRNVCFDTDGLQAIGNAVAETASSKPSDSVPASIRTP